ncbi:uncharacterized protein EDB91DRAFT_396495 [Suillus paluster]|uniref:uncharacterized protein n=1 Tax=Suillus paluster TaxID=48578 RepID=UPI001B87C14E|nr:uncharacterized protein EDB91DRAFT_396495 [Suillus paluster]KAG1739181.1 hypothetical protein EDB91DRAFT_396495 [Suillus paluster]
MFALLSFVLCLPPQRSFPGVRTSVLHQSICSISESGIVIFLTRLNNSRARKAIQARANNFLERNRRQAFQHLQGYVWLSEASSRFGYFH